MDAENIFRQLTLEEKATLLTGKKNWWMNGIPRLGIRDFMVGDGPHGLRAYKDKTEHDGHPQTRMPATAFPSASEMASTWNADLMKAVGRVIGEECNHYGVDILLGPGVDGKRSPLGGRNFEYYSEDPVLSGKMGSAFVQGVQSTGVGTSVKHFALNEQETSRRFNSSEPDERTFRELYALPFEMIVKEADPLTLMGAYNKIHGVYACQNADLLTKLLREEWKYPGIVMSDWGGVQDKRQSVLAGLDVEMPQSEWKDAFILDVLAGKYPLGTIDAAVLRILKAYERMLANPDHGKPTDLAKNHLVAQEAAREGIVLLKNEKNILPLNPEENILVLGDFAGKPRMNGGGSSELMPYRFEIPIDSIRKFNDAVYFPGFELTPEIRKALHSAGKVILFTGTTPDLESEGFDRPHMRLPENQILFVQNVARLNPAVIVVNASGSAIETWPFLPEVQGFIQDWFLGSASGDAVADILFGIVNPSGKLSETFPIRLENTPTYPAFPDHGEKAVYSEGLFTGYRFYDTHQIPVAFPFGSGLSYTTFAYSDLRFSKETISNGEGLKVLLEVTNTGSRFGKEIVELYVKPLDLSVVHPEKTLKAFVKVALDPGETKTIEFGLTDRDFAFYSVWKHAFVVEKGRYEIQVGASVADIRLKKTVFFDSIDVTKAPLTLDHPVSWWLNSETDRQTVEAFLGAHRKLYWWEHEDSLGRIIRRIMRENRLPEENFAEIARLFRK